MISHIPYIGEILSLSTALVWAFSVIIFKKCGESIHPIGLNLFKNTLAGLLLVPTLLLFNVPFFPSLPGSDYLIIFVSGIIGISIGDTFFFMSLNRLGAGLSAIVDCLYSPFVILLAFLFLDENLSLVQLLGVVLIVSAVFFTSEKKTRANVTKRDLWIGIICGVLAMLSMAAGVVIVKPALDRVPLLWSITFRIYAGTAVLFLMLWLHPGHRTISRFHFSLKTWKYALIGSFFGAYVAVILWLAGMKYTDTSIASALNQTSNVFIFILAALLLREPINRQRVLAIIAAFIGVLLVIGTQ